MCPKTVDKQTKKQDILRAAMRVFAQKGVANTRMADVARAAGIGKRTIYEYFRSKEDIFAEAFSHFMEQTHTIMAKRLYKVHDPVERLAAYIAGWFEVIKESSADFLEIMMDFWAEGVRHAREKPVLNLKNVYGEHRQIAAQILKDGISKGKIRPVNSRIAASILIGALDGLVLQWIMDRDLFKLDTVAEVVTKSFIEGLRMK